MSIKNLQKLLSPDLRAILGPLLAIFAISALSFLIFTNFYTMIRKNALDFNENKGTEKLLDQKLLGLKEVRVSLDATNQLLILFPEKSPLVWVISQLRALSVSRSVTLVGFDVSKTSDFDEKTKKMGVSMKIDSPSEESFFGFLQDLNSIAPILTIEKVDIERDKNQGVLSSEIEAFVYWSPFPTTLPPITQKIDEITLQEQELISLTSKYLFPSFTFLSPSVPQDRPTPFN